ncbi:hypothetical protein J5N97_007341 [Dioscorea zingiberensis]|uniref:Uncharacterized protein n=1 Tax=Dioscorea zingiberensis TaxID=325984 RepID=A0A9D5DC38_9LILI|nr:hypothetical protein J5N97_007341 [Dioscorea zingiberensis]
MQPASNAQTPGTLPGSTNLSISDLRVFEHIENKPEFGSDFKPGYTESVIVNPLAGTSLCYHVKPSHLQHMHLASSGLEINPMESYHASSIANDARDYQVSIPAELYRPNISLSSNDLNQGRFNFSESQTFLSHQQPTEGNFIYKQPHQEVKNELYTTPFSAPSDSPAFTDGQYFGGSPM